VSVGLFLWRRIVLEISYPVMGHWLKVLRTAYKNMLICEAESKKGTVELHNDSFIICTASEYQYEYIDEDI
jgi:hypothetical protein